MTVTCLSYKEAFPLAWEETALFFKQILGLWQSPWLCTGADLRTESVLSGCQYRRALAPDGIATSPFLALRNDKNGAANLTVLYSSPSQRHDCMVG